MHIENDSNRRRFQLSLKDHFLIVVMGLSKLLGFALSFSVFHPDGRPYLFCGCLLVYLLCICCLGAKSFGACHTCLPGDWTGLRRQSPLLECELPVTTECLRESSLQS